MDTEEKKALESLSVLHTDTGAARRIQPNIKQQNRLLQGIIMHPGDLKAASKYAGIRNMADTYRTLDRLALRKDYQMTLLEYGIDMPFVVAELKDLIMNAETGATKLQALKTVLSSLGLDRYGKEEEGSMAGWEKMVSKAISGEKREDVPALPEGAVGVEVEDKKNKSEVQMYEVKVPKTPSVAKAQRLIEEQLGKEVHE